MAEFVEVMRQAERLCDAQRETGYCAKCPLQCEAGYMLYGGAVEDIEYAKVGHIVMQWAKEHPEPVYPSWTEGWKQLFPDGDDVPCLGLFDTKYYACKCMETSCAECKNAPMPPKIAEKLGIKPKEASE